MSKSTLRDSLNLPQTDFPMRAGLPKNEPVWLERWQQEDIYTKLRKKSKQEGRKPFILHCGPPYANGGMHLGHALSCTLKDIVVRSQQMMGADAVFVPGWDCHGLPIEWKVEEGFKAKGKSKDDFSVTEIRNMCREFAAKWVDVQKEDWQRFGVTADFENPYLTMNPKNEAGIYRELGKLATEGYLYKGVKSIMWSTVEETSLAEAEVEYADKESLAIYVKFALVNDADNASVVIWTTTPWTMPANKAVAYGVEYDYVKIKATAVFEKATAEVGDVVWVAESLVEDFTKMTGYTEYEVLEKASGSVFEGLKAKHPFYDVEVPLLAGHHVTIDSGTGFVHIAPSHGADDFEIGQKYGLDLICHVNGDGSYDEEVGGLSTTDVTLTGVNIWKAQKKIIEEMTQNGTLMRWYKLTHSYPVSWRSKAPLIFRTTAQWFVSMDKETGGRKSIRTQALESIAKIGENNGWIPAYGEKRIGNMIENRPDWCVSRQRAWGVPIAIFKNTKTDEYIFDADVIEHVARKMEVGGINVWEELSTGELLPEGWLEANNVAEFDLEKETDILDVWFDSGASYAHVVEQQMGQSIPADLYLEGSDQHRGWFHSSLLLCTGARQKAPYKQVLTHGFVVDGEGKKMSKSLGNGIEPKDLLKQYGMDIVRMWVASSDYSEDVRISDEILKGTADNYRRFRNTFRFLLGNLYDFDEAKDAVAYDDLPELEKWVLAEFHSILAEAKTQYGTYQFHNVFQSLHNFCAKELSNLYFDIRKDSLYCDARTYTEEAAEQYHRRRSCQTVLLTLLKGLTTYLAPIMPFTTDEVWRAQFGEEACIHMQDFMELDAQWADTASTKWENIWALRDKVNMEIEEKRADGVIGSNLEASVALSVDPKVLEADTKKFIEDLHTSGNLADIFVVSSVNLTFSENVDDVEVQVEKASGSKCERCWKYVNGDDAVTLSDGTIVSKRDSIALKANTQTNGEAA